MKSELAPSSAIENHELFHDHPAIWHEISPHIRQKTYRKDDVAIHHGDAANYLWLVVQGWVKLTRQTPDGKETIVGLCTQGDVFGEAALFAQAHYPYHAQINTDHTELVMIPSAVIRKAIAADQALSASIMALLSTRTSQAQLKLEQLSTMSAAQRIGCFLLRLCKSPSGNQAELQIPIEKHVLAAYLGMKPETLSRSLQQLKEIGVQVNGPQLLVSDISRLRDLVCNSCSESGNCDAEEAMS